MSDAMVFGLVVFGLTAVVAVTVVAVVAILCGVGLWASVEDGAMKLEVDPPGKGETDQKKSRKRKR